MLRLFIHLLVFTLGLVPLFWVTTPKSPASEARLIGQPEALLLWGDSRTHDGIDLEAMSDKLKRPVVSFAKHGAGVYDFLVFAERAPKKCDAIVALSFPVFTREANTAYNRTGLSYWALGIRHENGVPLGELWEIYMHNHRGGTSPAHTSTPSLANAPAPIFHSFGYEGIAADARIHNYYQGRIDAMRTGVAHLLKKGCSVSMVEIPVADELVAVRNATPFTNYGDWATEFADQIPVYRPQVPEGGENLFHDLSHLNARGQTWLTQWLVDRVLAEAHTSR